MTDSTAGSEPRTDAAEEGRKTTITEAALRGLVSQVPGLRMSWPEGQNEPTIYAEARSLAPESEGLREAEGVVSELLGAESSLTEARERLTRATNTLGGILRRAALNPESETGSAAK